MSEELKITEVEVQKLNVQPGDVLMVTVHHEDVSQESLEAMSRNFKSMFPRNKVALFAMGAEGYVKFTVATQADTGYTTQRSNCDDTSYCSDCDCGKKERVEKAKEEKENGKP